MELEMQVCSHVAVDGCFFGQLVVAHLNSTPHPAIREWRDGKAFGESALLMAGVSGRPPEQFPGLFVVVSSAVILIPF
jgi:hypothetical protein